MEIKVEYQLQHKIFNDKKMNKYLKDHSQWYKELNRTPDNFKNFQTEYKKYQRNEQYTKITSAVDTLDTVNTIFKIIN